MKQGTIYKVLATTAIAGQVLLAPLSAYAEQVLPETKPTTVQQQSLPMNLESAGGNTVRVTADEIDLDQKPEKDVKSWEDTEYKKVESSLSSTEKTKLRDYMKNIEEMNRYVKDHIYTYEYDQDTTLNKSIEDVEKIFTKSSLSRPMAVYKEETPETFGFSENLYKNDSPSEISLENINKFKEQIVNQTYRLDGYTKTDLTSGKNAKNPIILCLHLPAGTHAMLYKPEELADMNMLLKDGYGIKPENVKVITKQGKQYVKVDATVIEPLDFKDDASKAKEWGEKQYKAWGENLTEDQKTNLNGYMLGQEYKEINKYLWEQGPEKNPNPDLDKKITSIEGALKTEPIPEDITVYRRMGAAEFDMSLTDPAYNFNNPENVKAFQKKWEGQIKENLGFLSTSLSSEKVGAFATRKFILRLHVLKGTQGAYVSGLEGYQNELEVLLNPGYSYKINKITSIIDKGVTKLVIDANIIPK
ncbi:ADP-ribosyltransferase (plasmid) [Bacillus cereus]|uniref:ADP ribosyltransferase domain-containing protein n=1 Tax=Bacillus cereus TaxID=1396 RepID=A0A9X6GD05_BACCE|nr:ADP-ribosyltransferase [Bacillus cereus]OOR71432.1 hypothetical protein BLX06_30755 [Bacillus cereus]UIJ69762.1 ADP-ribosyltransferase [Bacillus cereus]UIJ69830.1 ADP-ribosyltransferase [Bacillus cereus]